MRIRKNAKYLTAVERETLTRAFLQLKIKMMPGVTPAMSVYDYYVLQHVAVQRVILSGETTARNFAHGVPAFLPWHREFLWRMENELRAAIPGVTDNLALPYWDWAYTPPTVAGATLAETDPVLRSDFMGHNGGAALPPVGGNLGGYFAYNAPTSLPTWWPEVTPGVPLPGWRVLNRLNTSATDVAGTASLRRYMGPAASPTSTTLDTLLGPLTTSYAAFRNLESSPHGSVHNWFSAGAGFAQMSDMEKSANDPIFFFHHCNVDRIWALWQLDGHWGDANYAGGSPYGLTDPMWPWGFAVGSFTLNNWFPSLPVPNHASESQRRPQDVLDHYALGYRYDTEIVLGVALDRSGSMSGPTPDPTTGSPPNLTKWDAAKMGVTHLLQDCATAHAARDAYVVAGVLTFTTDATGNALTPVFSGAPSGVVKTGSYDGSAFNAALGTTGPGGGTPIAAALSATEATLVRAPFPTGAASDPRYIAFLTDGLETSPPLLNTLSANQYASTRIFALGFGIGAGSDGVSYTGIQTIVDKGMPSEAGVNQVFHGENANEVNKFFSDTITKALDYSHTTDPTYELYPGEMTHTPFAANSSDDALLITAVGFDYNDKNWQFELVGPDGTSYTESVLEPVSATFGRGNGRLTIIVKRNSAGPERWIGTWRLASTYMPGGGAKAKMSMAMAAKGAMTMVMPSLWDVLLPPGSPSVRGLQYAKAKIPALKRAIQREIPDRAAMARLGITGAQVVAPAGRGAPCALAVNGYHRGRMRAVLKTPKGRLFAGRNFDLDLALEGLEPFDFTELEVTGRLVAPGYSLGNLFVDRETVPVSARAALVKQAAAGKAFDELGYLIAYEHAKPGALAIRDDALHFAPQPDGTFRAHVTNNLHPGIYRMAVMVQGSMKTRGGASAEPFFRILATEVPVGIDVDPIRSKLRVHWLGVDRFVVSLTPTDRLGNVAAPTRIVSPTVLLNGVALAGAHVNAFTGEQSVEVKLSGSKVSLDSSATAVASGSLVARTADGKELVLKSKAPLRIDLQIAGLLLSASAPALVGDRRTKRAHPPGTKAAMDMPMEHRDHFMSHDEARAAGFRVK